MRFVRYQYLDFDDYRKVKCCQYVDEIMFSPHGELIQ